MTQLVLRVLFFSLYNSIQWSFSLCVLNFTFPRQYARRIRSVRYRPGNDQQPVSFTDTSWVSRKSREKLLQHYRVSSCDGSACAGKKRTARIWACDRKEKGNMRSVEQFAESNNEGSLFLRALDGACTGSFRRAIGRKSEFDNNDELFVFHETNLSHPPSVAMERITRLKRRWWFQSQNREYPALCASRAPKLQDCDHHHELTRIVACNVVTYAYRNKTIYEHASCVCYTVMLKLYFQKSNKNKDSSLFSLFVEKNNLAVFFYWFIEKKKKNFNNRYNNFFLLTVLKK